MDSSGKSTSAVPAASSVPACCNHYALNDRDVNLVRPRFIEIVGLYKK